MGKFLEISGRCFSQAGSVTAIMHEIKEGTAHHLGSAGEHDGKFTATGQGRADADRPLMQLHKFANDGQAQAPSTIMA